MTPEQRELIRLGNRLDKALARCLTEFGINHKPDCICEQCEDRRAWDACVQRLSAKTCDHNRQCAACEFCLFTVCGPGCIYHFANCPLRALRL